MLVFGNKGKLGSLEKPLRSEYRKSKLNHTWLKSRDKIWDTLLGEVADTLTAVPTQLGVQ